VATDQTAPGGLELVRSYVNTLDKETGEDQLSTPRALGGWLADNGLLARSTRLDADDLRRAVALREALRGLLLANNGGEVRRRDIDTLDRAAETAQLTVRFRADGGAELEPCRSGLDAAIGRIAAIVFEARLDGRWPRLKACPADDCEWAFYDHSRNRSGTWCTMAECGNRSKVRAYRARSSGS
jgi:predicted RNA-binding Zn ribbon-like protein